MRFCAGSGSTARRSGAFGHYLQELLYGATKSQRPVAALERLRELINLLPALSLPETAPEAYGTICAEPEAKGEMIENNDLWIAAHALASKLTLVTNNEKEFQRVRGAEGAKLGQIKVRSAWSQ